MLEHFPHHSPLYNRLITMKLTGVVGRHKKVFSGSTIDMDKVLQTKCMLEFDKSFSCPLLGYDDPRDYYTAQSCAQHLQHLNIPLLMVNAEDDPLFVPTLLAIPRKHSKINPYLLYVENEHGGHLGFAQGNVFARHVLWSDEVCLQYIRAVLDRFKQVSVTRKDQRVQN
eukprot:TRINITY_DN15167_c0_g1_i1.p1 TRINITY_DN15167_c0_g1~~TRINITY_DN15167_c0_g1_i1.p1  ORF type:complete len:192 (+),score=28.13 TRINITY_DN15167_c0_g1_i1:72-578(+)